MASEDLLTIPWELMFDHLVIRALCLMDLIRGMQHWGRANIVAPSSRVVDKIRYITFYDNPPTGIAAVAHDIRQKLVDARLKINLDGAPPEMVFKASTSAGFYVPHSVDAYARPIGPSSSPLGSVKRNPLQMKHGLCTRWTYNHINVIKVPWLDSVTKDELKEAVLKQNPAAVYIFLFTMTDLVDSGESVFELFREMGNSLMLMAPATKVHLLAQHLLDWEIDCNWLFRAQGSKGVHGTLKLLMRYVSSFARERKFPIVQFIGESYVSPIMKDFAREGGLCTR